MKMLLTLTLKQRLDGTDSTMYEADRDELIEKLEAAGWAVELADEEELDFDEGDDDEALD